MRRAALLAAALLAAGVGRAVAQDATEVDDLAQLLAAQDRREFDAGLMSREAQHPDSLVRMRAAMAMGNIGDSLALPILVRLLQDPDTTVGVEAAFALGRIGDRDAVPDLARQMELLPDSSRGPWPQELATALCRLGGPDADAAIAQQLHRHPADQAQNDEATTQALLDAWRLGRGSRTAALLPDYVRRSTGQWRENAVYSAGRLELPAAAPLLLDATSDDDATIRMWALRGLTAALADSAHLTHDAFVARIRSLLHDSVPGVRVNALRALATFADSSLVPYVTTKLIDRDPNVPVQAAATLGALGGSRAVAAIVLRLATPGTFALQRALLLGLAAAAPDSAVATVRPLMTDRDWRMRFMASEVLGAAGTPAARAAALTLTGDQDPRVVGGAFSALGQASAPGDSAVLAAARAHLSDADVVVRSAAIDLLGRERDPALVPALVGAYRLAVPDAEADARLSAVTALAGIWRSGDAARARVEQSFLAAVPRSGDYRVRRLVADLFGLDVERRYWTSVLPVETGRSAEDYREAVRRYLFGSPAEGSMLIVIETDHGVIDVQLDPFDAPLTVDNFVRLVDRRFFDNGRFHRVVPNFVIQDGDPRGDGNGGPGLAIRDEINRRRYDTGVIGMALSGPDTGGSQFFITLSPQPHLDGAFTAFGIVAGGLDVMQQIVQGDRIRRIYR